MQTPFPVITYADAMDRYGIDRPDLRFGVELRDLTDVVKESGFGVFRNAVAGGGQVKAVVYPGGAQLPRREIDGLTDFVKQYGAKGLAWIGVTGEPDADGLYGDRRAALAGGKVLLAGRTPRHHPHLRCGPGRSDPGRRRSSRASSPKACAICGWRSASAPT